MPEKPKCPCLPPSLEPFLCLNSQQELRRSTCSPFRKKVKLKGKPRCRLEMNWNISELEDEGGRWDAGTVIKSSIKSVTQLMSTSTLTSLTKLALVHTQVLSSTVLLKHFDLVRHVGQVVRKMHRFAKIHHVDSHSALVGRAPQDGRLLDGN